MQCCGSLSAVVGLWTRQGCTETRLFASRQNALQMTRASASTCCVSQEYEPSERAVFRSPRLPLAQFNLRSGTVAPVASRLCCARWHSTMSMSLER